MATSALQPINLNSHIMISYSSKYKNKCSKINDELNKRGYKTWMDVNLSFTDLYDAMAKAIENASIVLVCYSHEYKMSNRCRLEAQYAVKLNKNIIAVKLEDGYNPDGWLGLVLAAKPQVSLSKGPNCPVSYTDLFSQIDSLLNILNVSEILNSPVDWKKHNVQKWFKDNHLYSLAVVFQDFDGIALKRLWDMKQTIGVRFDIAIDEQIEKSKVEVQFSEVINFYTLLDKLFLTVK